MKNEKQKSNWDDVIKEIEAKHPNIVVPRDQNYVNSKTKIKTVCKNHGEQTATSASLRSGIGCKDCATEYMAKKRKKDDETDDPDADLVSA